MVALILPSLGVAVARFGLPLPGPAIAVAGSATDAGLPPVPVVGTRGSEQREIETSFRVAAAKRFGASPVYNAPEPVTPILTQAPDEPEPEVLPSPEQPVEIPTLTLSSVMGSKAQPMAVIEGRLRRVGEVVTRGWRVSSIDVDAGVVVLKFGDVETVLKLPPRGYVPR